MESREDKALPPRELTLKLFQSTGGIQTIYSYLPPEELLFKQNLNKRFYYRVLPKLFKGQLKLPKNFDVEITFVEKLDEVNNPGFVVQQRIDGKMQIQKVIVDKNHHHRYMEYYLRKDKLYIALPNTALSDSSRNYRDKRHTLMVEYDIWTKKQTLNINLTYYRQQFRLTSFNHYILAVGGFVGRPMNSIDAFDVIKGEIEPRFPNLIEPAIDPLVTQVNKQTLFVIGTCQNFTYVMSYTHVQRLVYKGFENSAWDLLPVKTEAPHQMFYDSFYCPRSDKIVMVAQGESQYEFDYRKKEIWKKPMIVNFKK